MILLHVGAFRLDVNSDRASLWHTLAPHIRLLCSLIFVFAAALTPNGHWLVWATYGAGLFVVVLISRVSPIVLLKRVAVEFSFIAAVLLGTLFRDGGVILWQWGWLRITSEGLMVLGSVTTKALLSLLTLNLLVMTTPIVVLLQGLMILKVPPLLVAILSSMYRYTNVLLDEFATMRRAALSRNLMTNRRWQRLVLGNMIGSLFIRTFDRGERIHRAMLSRGYTGIPPAIATPKLKSIDIAAVLLTAGWIILGQLLHFLR